MLPSAGFSPSAGAASGAPSAGAGVASGAPSAGAGAAAGVSPKLKQD